MPCYAYQGIVPVVDPAAFVHPLASLIGDVIVGPDCYIGPGASLRGDFGRIIVEADCSIQDAAVVHVSSESDTRLRRGATIAHGAVIHGCDIGANAIVGINAVVLDGAVIGDESCVGALSPRPGRATTCHHAAWSSETPLASSGRCTRARSAGATTARGSTRVSRVRHCHNWSKPLL